MADGRGGYRRPNKPAAVSGPGKFSQRTDGGPDQPKRYLRGDGSYGDSKSLNEVASGAPMAQAPSAPMPEIIPLSAPTQRPDEPVTAGMPFGPGPGPNIPPAPPAAEDDGPDVAAAYLRAAYEQFPSKALRRIVERLNEEGR